MAYFCLLVISRFQSRFYYLGVHANTNKCTVYVITVKHRNPFEKNREVENVIIQNFLRQIVIEVISTNNKAIIVKRTC